MEAIKCSFLEYIPPSVQSISILNDYCLILLENSTINLYKLPSWSLILRYQTDPSMQLSKVTWHSRSEFIGIGSGIYLWSYSSPKVKVSRKSLTLTDIFRVESEYAIVSQDGSFSIYEIDPPDISHVFMFNKHEPFTCVTGSDGTFYTGSIKGSLLEWQSGNPSSTKRSAISTGILTILLQNEHLLTGDETGEVVVWDKRTLTHLQAIWTHQSRILAMISHDNSVFCTGTDSKIVKLEKVDDKWIFVGKARAQSHEVRAIGYFRDYVISGGVNSDIAIVPLHLFISEGTVTWNSKLQTTKFRKTPIKHIPTLPWISPICQVGMYALYTKDNSIDLWAIDNDLSKVSKALTIQSSENIVCSVFNKNFIVYSSLHKLRIYALELEPLNATPIEHSLKPAYVLDASADHLFTGSRYWEYFSLKEKESHRIKKFECVIRILTVKGRYCAINLIDNRILVACENLIVCEMPTLTSTVTAIGFAYKKKVYFAVENNNIHGFNLRTQEPDNFINKFGSKFPKNFLMEHNKIVKIQPNGRTGILVNTIYSFTFINFLKKPPRKSQVITRDSVEDRESWRGILSQHPLHSSKNRNLYTPPPDLTNFAINKRFGPILNCSLTHQKLCVHELDWEKVLNEKPKPFIANKYRNK